jgi:hypothetical protein
LTSVVWCRNDSSTSWIKAKVGLVHQLLVKWRVYILVVVLLNNLAICANLVTVFEEFV